MCSRNATRIAFDLYDKDKDGFVTKSEMEMVAKVTMSKKAIDVVFDHYDADKDGKLSYDEFCKMIATDQAGNKLKVENPNAEVERAFSLYDEDNDGYITKSEMEKIARKNKVSEDSFIHKSFEAPFELFKDSVLGSN